MKTLLLFSLLLGLLHSIKVSREMVRQLFRLRETYHSFLQMQLQISTHSVLSSGDRALMRSAKRRVTQDGRKCAAKF